jgi:ribose 5-phosphate isomerase B
MKISFGLDHGALALREPVLQFLREEGHTVIDHGTNSADSVDYPDYSALVCRDVLEKTADLGILACTTGIGMSIAANAFPGIRAALVLHEDSARLTREHNHSNVLCLDSLHTTPYMAKRLIKTWLEAEPEGGRHQRRVDKIASLSANHSQSCQS